MARDRAHKRRHRLIATHRDRRARRAVRIDDATVTVDTPVDEICKTALG